MKPFDLLKAKEGWPVCTRSNLKVRIISFNIGRMNPKFITAIVYYPDGYEECIPYYNNGKIHRDVDHQLDLQLADADPHMVDFIDDDVISHNFLPAADSLEALFQCAKRSKEIGTYSCNGLTLIVNRL